MGVTNDSKTRSTDESGLVYQVGVRFRHMRNYGDVGNVVFGSKHFPEWANVTAIASRT